MDIRNIQKTGNMHYVYLPTSWCKQYKISSDTKVSLQTNSDGSLSIFPDVRESKEKTVHIELPEATPEVLIKLVMACYINPTSSFTITLGKEIDISKILSQKKSISALEFVDLDENNITHESSISIKDSYSLLRTMVKKIKSLVQVMDEHYDGGLVDKYEEEIDKSKLLITKAITSALVLQEPTKSKPIDLYYMALIAQDLERMVDSLILVEEKEKEFFKQIGEILELMLKLIGDVEELKVGAVIELQTLITKMRMPNVENLKTYGLRRINIHFESIADIFFDWAITKEVQSK